MKKLTKSILAVVLTSSFVIVNAQETKKDTDEKEIEGVVVTALGIKREKKSLGYASKEVKAEALTSGTTNTGNVASLLSGKVAGLQVKTNNNFGGSSNLLIRGYKSLGGGSPLIVIDGSPVNNSTLSGFFDYGNFLSDINQEDIESMNVLKGAAASALYGERGSDGVIVIVTKSGKSRDANRWGVTLNSSITAGFIDKSTFPTYQTRYGAGYGPYYSSNDGYFEVNADGTLEVPYGEDASYGGEFNPNTKVYQWDAFDKTSPNFGKATPWVAAQNGPIKFFDTPLTFVNTIGIDKGNNKNNFSLSYTNMLSNGLLPNSNLRKNTLSTKFGFALTDKLTATVYSTLTIQNTVGRNETGYSDNLMSGFRQWWQTNVDLYGQRDAYYRNYDKYGVTNSNVTWNRISASDGTPLYWNNPYFQRWQNFQSDDRIRSFSYAQLKYDINKNLSLTTKVSHDQLNMTIEERLAVGSLAQSFGASGQNVASGYAKNVRASSETNFDLIGNYKYQISDKLGVQGVVGGNLRRNTADNNYASTEGGLIVPGLYSLSNSKLPTLPVSEYYAQSITTGIYATASFDYDKFFYLDGTYRIDRSSNLPKENNTYGYYSLTGALILSELVKQDWMSFWKVRANYAEVGSSTSNYQLVNTYSLRGGSYFNQPYFLANANLKPQRSKEFEVGMEMQFMKNRFGFDVAYYKTRTLDQLMVLPVSSGSGYRAYAVNAGRIDNEGFEAQVNISPIRTAAFRWDIDINWAKNKSLVVELVPGTDNYLMATYNNGVSLNARIGQPFGTLEGNGFEYLNGQKVVSATTGRYLIKPNQVIGNITPDWTGGLRNSFSYKGLSMSFLIDVKKGGNVYSTDMAYGLATGMYAETAEGDYRIKGLVHEGVNPNGSVNTKATIQPEFYGNVDGYRRMPAERFVYDASYVKLREASIGYTLPQSLISNTFISDAKISIVGRNLWIIHKNLPYADPEAGVGGGLRGVGHSIGLLPTTRDIGVDITLKF